MYSHSPNQSTTSLSDVDDDDVPVGNSVFFNTEQALVVSPAKWASRFGPLRPRIRTLAHSPVSHLPPEVLIHILKHLHYPRDLHSALLVCRAWCECTVELLWHKPCVTKLPTFVKMIDVLARTDQTFTYAHFIRRLNFLFLGPAIVDSHITRLAVCDRLERLTLVGCSALSDETLSRVLPCCGSLVAIDLTGVVNTSDRAIVGLASVAKRLQGINLGGCKNVTDEGIMALATNCSLLRRVKLSGVEEVTDAPISAIAKQCPFLLEIDLNKCKQVTDVAVRDIWVHSTYMRELRLANCNLTDAAFPSNPTRQDNTLDSLRQAPNPFPSPGSRAPDQLPPLFLSRPCEYLRMLDLTACGALTDDAIDGVVAYAPKLRNLVLSKCVLLTDRSVETICRLGRYVHFLHFGHASSITDRSVRMLARCCTRIRYIDFANCTNLTDMSVFELSGLPKLRRIGLVRVNNLTDEAVYALGDRQSSLERIHLSYCDQITVLAVHYLLQKLPKLNHLSLTGIPAFRRPELQGLCRAPPPEYNMSQRAAFCVYSGKGVANLRAYLMELFESITEEMNTTDDTEYDDDDHFKIEENPDVEMEVVEEDEDLPNPTYVPPPTLSSHSPQLALHTPTSSQHHVVASSSQPAARPSFSSSFAAVDQPMEPILPTNSNASISSNPFGFLTSAPRRIRGFGQQLVVERNDSPPPSDAASNRSAQSSNGAFFRTYQEATRSNGARTPDLNFAEIGHGRGGYPPAGPIPGPSGLSHTRSPIESIPSQHNLSLGNVNHQPDNRTGLGFDTGTTSSNSSGRNLSSQWSFLHREPQSPSATPGPMAAQAPAAENREMEGRGRSVRRGLRSTFAFATSTFSFGRGSEGAFSFGNKGGK